MQFVKDEDLNCWETEVIFKESPVILTIVDDSTYRSAIALT